MRIIETDELGMRARLAEFLNNTGPDGMRLHRIAKVTEIDHGALIQIIAGSYDGEIPRRLLNYAGMRRVIKYEFRMLDQPPSLGDD